MRAKISAGGVEPEDSPRLHFLKSDTLYAHPKPRLYEKKAGIV